MGDADRLDQVFTNLVDNALKHTPPGGEVDLSARQVNDWIEVIVSDTGPGVPPEELERIFERFYQTDKARRGGDGRGVGLGLAIANEIVLAHGGLISAHNRQDMTADEVAAGSGSVFVVRLPVSRPDVETHDRRK
jgi:two-component system sensor histidine kinase ResE